ncbi:MAG: hypothetical protein OHK0024_14330 [Thalassobaculales bacterium]
MAAGRREADPGIDEIRRELEGAVVDHADWLDRWHRSLLCGVKAGPDILSENAHFLCRFGGWYDLRAAGGLLDQPAFKALGDAHRLMHDHARILAERSGRGRQLPAEEYDAFIAKVRVFRDRARRLEKAFAKVVSEVDPLTGAHNRQGMAAILERERERALRGRVPLTLALADLDRFKAVNDTYGHPGGDTVLHHAATIFLSGVRPYDWVFRYGGEEFLFCLPDAAPDDAIAVLERLRQRLEQAPVRIDATHEIMVTASFGLACLEPGLSVEGTIDRADRALYFAKQNGRNRVCLWGRDVDGDGNGDG